MFAAEIRKRRIQSMRSSRFNSERSLSSRKHFKLNRAAALTEWCGLCAA